MNKLSVFLIVATCILISSCAHQDYGVSEYTLKQDGTFVVKSGKEVADVEALMTRGADGKPDMVYFKATGVTAFEGQRIGAEVGKHITNAVRELLPELVSQAVKAALGTKALDGAGMLLSPQLPPGATLPAQ